MSVRPWLVVAGLVVCGAALAQQAPPPPPSSSIPQPAPPPGLSVELAAAAKLVREGQYDEARTKVDAVLAGDAKNPQAKLKLVRELFAVPPSETPPKPVVPKPAAKPRPKK